MVTILQPFCSRLTASQNISKKASQGQGRGLRGEVAQVIDAHVSKCKSDKKKRKKRPPATETVL
jgi:hypothetical protein